MPNNVSSLLLLDVDYDEAMPSHFKLDTAEDVWNTLVTLFPLLAYVSMLIRPSSSAGVFNTLTGIKRTLFSSWHIYLVITNSTAETNKNFVEFLKRRAWLPTVNLAYAHINGVGVCERYYMDLAVHSAERLIVESTPLLEAPLAKEHIKSSFFEGASLDLASIDYNIEPDYREVYAQEKEKLMATLLATDKKVSATIRSKALASTSKNEGPIFISESAKAKVIDIYMYLQNTQKPETKGIKSILDDEVTSALLTFLGYHIDSNYKFKLRDEKTPSCSIAWNGYIKDFGGAFSGGIIDFIMHVYGVSFNTSWTFFRSCFGVSTPPLPTLAQQALPYPKNFEKRLEVNTNNFTGQI